MVRVVAIISPDDMKSENIWFLWSSCWTQDSEIMKIEDRQTAVEAFVVVEAPTATIRQCHRLTICIFI